MIWIQCTCVMISKSIVFGGVGWGVLVKTSANQPKQLFLTFSSPASMTNYWEQELASTKREKHGGKHHQHRGCDGILPFKSNFFAAFLL